MPLKNVKKTEGAAPVAAATPSAEAPKAKAAAAAVASVEKIDEDIIGSKSHTIAFVAALGDPSRDDITPKENKDGTTTKSVDPVIVGYRFKVLEDMEVPDCGAGPDMKDNVMTYVDSNGKKAVKAGTLVDLTKFETAMLLSPPEFNGKATGGEKAVTCAYQTNARRLPDGTVSKVSSAVAVPSVSLRAVGGSIKDFEMIPVLTFDREQSANGVKKVNKKIIPGFEKWESLCRVATRRSSTGSAAGAKKVERNKGAEAFLAIVAGKAAAK